MERRRRSKDERRFIELDSGNRAMVAITKDLPGPEPELRGGA
jgi:hypothetical protein